jgi:two-component system OmpR family response regulator
MDRAELQRVLYVDDEPDIRQVVQLALGLLSNVTTHTADGGEQAIEMSRESRPDLVLLDVMMPGMDGPSTLMRLREDPQLKEIPVIFMTAKAMPREVARFRAMGAAGVIAKPFDPMQLGKQVMALWESIPVEAPMQG